MTQRNIQTLKYAMVTLAVTATAVLAPYTSVRADNKTVITLPKPLGDAADKLRQVSNNPFPGVFGNLFNFVFSIVFILAVLALIVSGLRYITAYGSEAYMKKAKNNLYYAILGLIVVILAYTIAATINAFLT